VRIVGGTLIVGPVGWSGFVPLAAMAGSRAKWSLAVLSCANQKVYVGKRKFAREKAYEV
jgi:hypothetical protein